MAGYTSWGQRKALGRRYSTDPALQMEQERLDKEYSMLPQRMSLDQSKYQFEKTLEENEKARRDQMTAGMIGTASNVGGLAAMLRAATKGKNEPFFGGLFGSGSPVVDKTATDAFLSGAGTSSFGVTSMPSTANLATDSILKLPTAGSSFVPGGVTDNIAQGLLQSTNPAMIDTAATTTGVTAAGTDAAASGMLETAAAWGTPLAEVYAAAKLAEMTGGVKEIPKEVGELGKFVGDVIEKPFEIISDVVSDAWDTVTGWF